MTCSKCHTRLHECSVCKGQTATSILGDKLTCRACNSTGWVCGNHDGYWE